MTSFNPILPELNSFITDLEVDKKGLIITLFTISAAYSHFEINRYYCRKSNLSRYYFFNVHPLDLSIFLFSIVFLTLRFLHGFSADLPHSSTALLTDIIPAEKRGQAMGIWVPYFTWFWSWAIFRFMDW